MGQHDPLNRFLLLDDLDESVCPEDPEKDVRRCILDPKCYVWLENHVPGFENHDSFECSSGLHAPNYTCHHVNLIDHLEAKKERCIYHQLAYVYINSVVSSKNNKLS